MDDCYKAIVVLGREKLVESRSFRYMVQALMPKAAPTSPQSVVAGRRPLPAGWRWVKLGEACEVVQGFAFPERYQGQQNAEVPFVKVSDMNSPGAATIVTSAHHTVSRSILEEIGARTYPPGTVIFPKVGGALLTNKKRILGVTATFDNNVMGLVPKGVVSRWLYYWMRTIDLRTLSNTQALPSIKKSRVAGIELALPPVDEQERIATSLDDQMAAVERAHAAVEQGCRMAELLNDRLAHWLIRTSSITGSSPYRLGDFILSARNGFGRRPVGVEEGPIVLRLADVSTGCVNVNQGRRVKMSEEELATYRVSQGDLLFIRVNGSKNLVGRCIFADKLNGDVAYNDHLIRVRLRDGLFPGYLSLVCNLPEAREFIILSASTTAGQFTINQEALSALPVQLPSLDTQRMIVRRAGQDAKQIASVVDGFKTQEKALQILESQLLSREISSRVLDK